jgi:hypothetical protein
VTVNLLAAVVFALLVLVLRSLRRWDQWHHGWLVLLAFDLPDWLRWAALAIGAHDLLQHLIQRFHRKSYVDPIVRWVYGLFV